MPKAKELIGHEPAAQLAKHNAALIKKEPSLRLIRLRLLKVGGCDVSLMLPDAELPLLLKRGILFEDCIIRLKKAEGNLCHVNAGRLWLKDKAHLRICTGYALSPDGMWRQHTWLIRSDEKKIIETTVRRTTYYGVVLDPGDESEFFCWNNECL